MKTGLVLEGGAMRGLFTAGVLDVLMERGVRFDGAIGVSAGACFGCNYKSGQVGRVIRYNQRFARDPRYCSWKSLLKTGDLFGADFCYRELPTELDVFDAAAYAANPMEFHVVATDCATVKPNTWTAGFRMAYRSATSSRSASSATWSSPPARTATASFRRSGSRSSGRSSAIPPSTRR